MLVPKFSLQHFADTIYDALFNTKKHLERPEHKLAREVKKLQTTELKPHNPYNLYVEMTIGYFTSKLKDDPIAQKSPLEYTKEDQAYMANINEEGTVVINNSFYFYDITFLTGEPTIGDGIHKFENFIYSDLFSDEEIWQAFLKCYLLEDDTELAVIEIKKKEQFNGGIMDIPIVKETSDDGYEDPLPV